MAVNLAFQAVERSSRDTSGVILIKQGVIKLRAAFSWWLWQRMQSNNSDFDSELEQFRSPDKGTDLVYIVNHSLHGVADLRKK